VVTESTVSAAAEEKAPPRKVSRRLLPILLLALAAGGYAVYSAYRATRPYEWSGTVEARTMTVGSRTGGRVKEVLAHEGDRVDAGQSLLSLEPGDLEAQRLQARAQLQESQANLEKLERGARPEEIEEAQARATTAAAALEEARHGSRSEEVLGSRARLVAMQVSVDKAQVDAERAHRLLSSGSISQAEAENAESALKGAVAQRDAANQALDELENGVRSEQIAQAVARAREARASAKLVVSGTRVEDLKAARAAALAAQGRLDQVEVLVDELLVKAPRASRVETLDLRPGDILAPNANAAVLLEDDQLYVRIYVPETQLGHLHVGDEVPVYVDSFPQRAFRGGVEHIDMQGEYSPRNLQTADERANEVFATRVGLRDGQGDLRAGMAAFIRVPR
jgi:multidrug resistance efflux pump